MVRRVSSVCFQILQMQPYSLLPIFQYRTSIWAMFSQVCTYHSTFWSKASPFRSFKFIFLEGPYEKEIRNQMVGWGPNLLLLPLPSFQDRSLSFLSRCCQKVQLELLFPLLLPPTCGSFLFTPLSLPPAADTPTKHPVCPQLQTGM